MDTSNSTQPTSFLIAKSTEEKNPESQLDKKMIERQELFTSEKNISTIKEEAISSDLSLGNREREKLFKAKRIKKTANIDSMTSLISKLTIPKDFYDQCNDIDIDKVNLTDIVPKIKSSVNVNEQYEALVCLRKKLSLQNPPIQDIIDYGLVSCVINFLDHPYPEFNYEALWCLTNIACGTSDQINSIAVKGGIAKIITLLDSNIEELINQTIWTLANLCSDSDRIRSQIINNKGYDKVLSILQTTTRPLLIKTSVFMIAQFAKLTPNLPYEVIGKAIPLVIKSIFNFQDDINFLVDACHVLSHVTEVHKNSRQIIIESDILPIIFKSLTQESNYVQLACLRIIGNIGCGNANQTQALLDNGLLQYLKPLINHQNKRTRKECVWIISNIAAGTQRQIESLILESFYPLLVNSIYNDLPEIKKEAIWAVCNFTTIEKKELLEMLIKDKLLELLLFCLKSNDANSIAISLEALGNLLLFGKKYYSQNGQNIIATRIIEIGMVDVLESLQLHKVQIIYEKVAQLLETYFETEIV